DDVPDVARPQPEARQLLDDVVALANRPAVAHPLGELVEVLREAGIDQDVRAVVGLNEVARHRAARLLADGELEEIELHAASSVGSFGPPRLPPPAEPRPPVT